MEFIKNYRYIATGEVDEVTVRWDEGGVEVEWDLPGGGWTSASFIADYPVEEEDVEEEADWLMSGTHEPV